MSMQVIQRVEVGSGGAASIVFSSIPQIYDSLYLVISGRNETNNTGQQIKINASTSNYTYRYLDAYNGTVSTASGAGTAAGWVPPSSATANMFSNTSYHFPNYTSSATKSYSGETVYAWSGANPVHLGLWTHRWNDSAAITSLTLTVTSGEYEQFSSATIYGITRGSDGSTTVS